MIGAGFIRFALVLDLLGSYDLCLEFLLSKDSVGEFGALVENGDLALIILVHRHLGMVQSIGGTIGLDLVHEVFELKGEVLGDQPSLLPGEDLVEIVMSQHGAMDIQGTARLDRKAGIEISDEFRQIGIALLHIVDPA